ncbi:MAG: VOC family protein [Thermoplasmata archaeon]
MTMNESYIKGPDFVALQVNDIEASRKFWIETIGLKQLPKAPPGAVLFDTKPIQFAIRTPQVDLKAVNHLGWGIALWMHADNVEALYNSLVKKKVVILQKLESGAFGKQFTFSDIDGYSVTVHGDK